jgi:hypothetical protein
MKRIARIGGWVSLGMFLGGGGILGLQAMGPLHSPTVLEAPPTAFPQTAPPEEAIEFFGLPSATAEEARPSVPDETETVRRYVPIPGSSVAGSW